MTATWQDVRCARIREGDLSDLADLRRDSRIRVTIDRGRAWVRWDDDPDAAATRRILVERLLPLSGVEIFSERDGRWHRPGELLPTFDVPVADEACDVPLDRVIVPEPMAIVPPGDERPRPVSLRLVRDDRDLARPAAAVRCRLRHLAAWADTAPSAWIESLSGAWCAVSGRDPGDAEVLLIGPTSRLPWPEDSVRFWGKDVLVPLGWRADPDLTERAIREAVGAGPDHLVVLDDRGPELVPRPVLERLDRARLRLAMAGSAGGPTAGGGRS